jgi:hypothetical protein
MSLGVEELPEELRESRELAEFRSWQLADKGEMERIQLRVESPALRTIPYVCCRGGIL